MENLGENQSHNEAPSEFIALGDLMAPEARTSETPAPPDNSRRDLKTLRELGYRYCNSCEQVIQPQIVSLRRQSGSFFFPYGTEHPLLNLLISLGKTSPAQSKKIWGCPKCGRDYRRLKRLKKQHFLPQKGRPKGIPRRFLIPLITVPLSVCCVCMYLLLPRSNRDRPPSRTPSDASLVIGDNQPLTRRVIERLVKRPMLASLPVSLESHRDSVTIAGRVPSCYEAMLIHRTVENTPGVRELVDRLEYQAPDENDSNPLVEKGRPDDVEPYLTYHIRRKVGGLAHVDPVLVNADVVQIRGTVLNVEDKDHVETVIKSIPVLRGFRVKTVLTPVASQANGQRDERTANASRVGALKFGGGDEVVNRIPVKVGDPQFTLTWDTDTDLDLHVIEPGGTEIYSGAPKGSQGGQLDLDNTKGFGPEKIYWPGLAHGPGSTGTTRTAPSGVYRWFVVYRRGKDSEPKLTHWRVRINHNSKETVVEGRLRRFDERSMTHGIKLD